MDLNDHDFSIYKDMTPKQIHKYLKTFKYKKAAIISKILVDLAFLPPNYHHGAALVSDAFRSAVKRDHNEPSYLKASHEFK